MNEQSVESGHKVYAKTDISIESGVDEMLILMHLEDGDFVSLQSTGRRIWELLDEPMSLPQICERLTSEFEVDATTCASETGEFLAGLEAKRLIEMRTSV